MRHLFIAAAAIVAVMAEPAAAQTADQQRQIDWTLERGRLIFALDRAAWVATDDLMERTSEQQRRGLIAYIVDRDSEGFFVLFFARENERAVAGYRARIGTNGVLSREIFPVDQRPPLTTRQSRMAAALQSVVGEQLQTCSPERPNIAVVPPVDDGAPIDVYITDPQMREGQFQFGGHQRITFDAQGRETARRRFTNSCLAVPEPPEAERARGVMLGVTHLLDSLPTEIHVFIAMAAQQQLAVITTDPERMWGVTGERIVVLQEGPIEEE